MIHRVPGHFGELLQGRLGPDGPVVLITLPCPVLAAEVSVRPGAFSLHQTDPKLLNSAEIDTLFAHLGRQPTGQMTLRVDMPPGGGAGASTAARVALARAAGETDPARIAAACLATEGASDPLMLPHPGRVLWASRQGRVVMDLPALPAFEVIGGFLGPGQRTDPADADFPDIADLVADWPAACADLPRLAAIASESARRTLALRGPAGDPTADLARAHGALGHAIAHTGSARALIYAPGTVPQSAAQDLRAAGFSGITRFSTGGA